MSAQHTPGAHWIIDGKDGPALLLYDENSNDVNRMVRVYGSDQQQIAEQIVAALNGVAIAKTQGSAA